MKKERDQLISQADELIKKATVVQSLLVEKNKRLKQLEYSKEQQQSISKRCLLSK
jgi:hypothetical protein